jgi:hypothetical protein
MPRLKDIASQKLHRPEAGRPADYPNLQPVLTRPIDWETIRRQYDEMVKYATALRLGTAEDILRRFARSDLPHPTYRALDELGRAVKTPFRPPDVWDFVMILAPRAGRLRSAQSSLRVREDGENQTLRALSRQFFLIPSEPPGTR